MTRFLTPEQVASYHRDGFLSPIRVMTEAEAARVRAEFEEAERRWPDATQGANRNNAHLNLMCLDRLVHDANVLDAVEDIVGPDILVCATVLFIKEPGDPGFVSWHQDATYMGLEPHDGVTAWIALSPSNRETGCMRMLPGSHREEIRPHEDTFGETNILTRGQTIADVDEDAIVDLELRPGEMSFHHPRVIHGSRPNRGRDRRIGFTIQSYLPPDVRQTRGTTYAQVARGENRTCFLPGLPRPTGDMDPEDVARRDRVNALWSDILYQGARQRRDY